MKPDGKIQGVDVWVRHEYDEQNKSFVVTDSPTFEGTKRWLAKGGILQQYGGYLQFPSREDALLHLRELEAKEKPVIDLTKAKFGDKFKRASGEIETYACPREGFKGSHVMQSGHIYGDKGYWEGGPSIVSNLVAPYTPPRTVEVWIEVYISEDESDSELYWDSFDTKEEFDASLQKRGYKTIATRKITLTEGEGLAEPDVA